MALLVRHMKTASQSDRLQSLLATLQHFDSSPDFGDAEAVAVIRKHLMVRIREAESAVRCAEPQREPMRVALIGNRLQAHAEAA